MQVDIEDLCKEFFMQVDTKNMYNIEVFTSVCDYFKREKERDTYKILENSQDGIELMVLCAKSRDLVCNINGFNKDGVEFDILSCKYDDFISVFNKYTHFNELCKAIKLDTYSDINDIIYVNITMQTKLYLLFRLKYRYNNQIG